MIWKSDSLLDITAQAQEQSRGAEPRLARVDPSSLLSACVSVTKGSIKAHTGFATTYSPCGSEKPPPEQQSLITERVKPIHLVRISAEHHAVGSPWTRRQSIRQTQRTCTDHTGRKPRTWVWSLDHHLSLTCLPKQQSRHILGKRPKVNARLWKHDVMMLKLHVMFG